MIATPSLSISPQKITAFIARAHRLDDAPALRELANIIDNLTENEQADMIALMWLGRGDGEIGEWNELREEAALLHNKRATAYLLAKPMLVDHLEEGLAALGYPSARH